MPEREAMDRLEDQIAPQLKSPVASLALVRTGNNLRQWTFYTRSEATFRKKLEQALRAETPQAIEVEATADPRWETYEQFVQGVRR